AVSTTSEVLLYDTSSLDVPARALNIAGTVNDILFSPTAPEILAVADDTHAYLYNINSGEVTITASEPAVTTPVITPAPLNQYSLSFSADGNLLGSVNPIRLFIYDVETKQSGMNIMQFGPLVAVSLSPDGQFAAGAEEFYAYVYLMNQQGHFFLDRGPNMDVIRSLIISPDSTKVVVGDMRGDVEMWDITGAKPDDHLERILAFIRAENDTSQSRIVNALAFSPDGSVIASAESDPQGIIRIFRSDNLQQVYTFGVYTGDTVATDVAFSPDGQYLAYTADHTVRILETEGYTQVAELIRSR
ncbi:MAG: hypothetical protein K8I60_10155, partial [Anaerolineae bacterium]|nr:hypothetical protein [Anaerolineae bacterium]